MESLISKIPCREEQLNDLYDLFGERDEPLPCSIFVSGSMATGKTLCLDTTLAILAYKYIKINCVECYSAKIMYEKILDGFDEDVEIKCDTLLDLINALNREAEKLNYEPIVLVFDKAERLRGMDDVFSAFLRLRELCNLNICTVFVSYLTYHNFYFKMGARQPITIYFPNYTKEELFKIIYRQQKSFISHIINNKDVDNSIRSKLEKPELFANFLNAFLSVFYRPCRDLIELRHMAKVNFTKYCEPIIRKEIQSDDLNKLWRHISPILKTSLELLYLRTSSSEYIEPSTKENIHPSLAEENNCETHTNYTFEDTLKDELISTKTFAQSFELPYYAKYLLISSYLASYNPPKEDKRLFMKNHGKQRKRLQQVRAKAKINEKLNTQLGPKMFTLDRLLAIFYAILENKVGLPSNLLAQLETLVQLKLISGSKLIDIDTAKYKCIVGYDFISAVGQTVGFNVRKYLYDFI